jgi:hypothetical protein
MNRVAKTRSLGLAAALLFGSACTGGGINAGEDGGIAFILFAIVLVATVLILWFILGRDE